LVAELQFPFRIFSTLFKTLNCALCTRFRGGSFASASACFFFSSRFTFIAAALAAFFSAFAIVHPSVAGCVGSSASPFGPPLATHPRTASLALDLAPGTVAAGHGSALPHNEKSPAPLPGFFIVIAHIFELFSGRSIFRIPISSR
jgi:hypothetical protein